MVGIKTSKERREEQKRQKAERDAKIMKRFNELCAEHIVSDAAIITANEFNLSVGTIYVIRRNDRRIS